MEVNSSIVIATLIAYTLLFTGSFSVPISETGAYNEPICHEDFDEQQSLSACSGEETTLRYYYNSIYNTCSETQTCSLSHSITYSSLEKCNYACIDDETSFDEKNCSLPQLSNGNAHIVNCDEKQCTVYYSCNHDNRYHLYPEKNRVERFQCLNGVWEDHTVYCAKVDVNILVDGVSTKGDISEVTIEKGKEVTLNCEVNSDAPQDTYNVIWSFTKLNQHLTEIVSTGNTYTLTSTSADNEGTYSCTVSGLINVQIETELIVTGELPSIKAVSAHANGDTIYGACYCTGNNVVAKWIVDDEIVDGFEFFPNEIFPDESYNKLELIPETHDVLHTVQCECTNKHNINIKDRSDIFEITTYAARVRKSVTEVNVQQIHTFCESSHSTAIIIGHALRQVGSTVHIKVEETLVPNSSDSFTKDNVIMVHSNQRLRRNGKYLIKLEQSGNRHSLVSSVPYVEEIKDIVTKNCR